LSGDPIQSDDLLSTGDARFITAGEIHGHIPQRRVKPGRFQQLVE
jgi:hypothetical protein